MPLSPAPRPGRSAGSAGAVAASTRRSAARAGGGTPGAGPRASPRRARPRSPTSTARPPGCHPRRESSAPLSPRAGGCRHPGSPPAPVPGMRAGSAGRRTHGTTVRPWRVSQDGPDVAAQGETRRWLSEPRGATRPSRPTGDAPGAPPVPRCAPRCARASPREWPPPGRAGPRCPPPSPRAAAPHGCSAARCRTAVPAPADRWSPRHPRSPPTPRPGRYPDGETARACLSCGVGPADVAVLLGAGVVAGVVSTVVSFASLVSYPALLAVGLPPVAANVTNTVALVFTAVGAAAGSRPELAGQGRRVLRLGLVTAGGGAAGAALLLLSPLRAFEAAAPWLIAGSSLLLLAQPRITPPTGRGRRGTSVLLVALFAVATYVGYFGAAGGVLMLAVLAAMLDQPLVRTNAVKNTISGAANGVAAVTFAVFGPVHWMAAAPLAAGFLVGGWLGPAVVRRLPGETLRFVVAGCGLLVAAAIAVTTYP